MKQINWKKIWADTVSFCRTFFLPPKPLLGVFTLVSVVSLVYIFQHGMEEHPLAYMIYPLAAYTLLAICLILYRALPKRYRRVKGKVYEHPTGHRYMTDAAYRVKTGLYISLGINLAYAVTKLLAGIWYESFWWGAVAVYYMVLSVLRFILLRYMKGKDDRKGLRKEYERYRLCGIFLLLLNLSLTGIVFQMVWQNRGYAYPGHLIFVVAGYAFYAVTVSIVDMVKYRRYHSPVLSAAKAIRLAAALVSVLTMETAMLAQFGDDPAFQRLMTALTGAGVCIIVLGMSVYMIVGANRALREMQEAGFDGK